nr:MAG TPA: hypothetical protein [Caudoviricetes sp.]
MAVHAIRITIMINGHRVGGVKLSAVRNLATTKTYPAAWRWDTVDTQKPPVWEIDCDNCHDSSFLKMLPPHSVARPGPKPHPRTGANR